MNSVGAVRESPLLELEVPPLPKLEPVPPRWVEQAFGQAQSRLDLGPHVEGTKSGDLVLLRVAIEQAAGLPVEPLRRQVMEAYQHLGEALAALDREPVRFWNFIPGLGMEMAPGLDRYMVFNAGRYDAFSMVPATGEPFPWALATASAVGIEGADLIVYCLASATTPIPVENPRQRSAWLYSERYGPRPPCFSRAAIATLHGRVRLLIGGTASIVGEESRHDVDVAAQLEETLRNVASVITAATGRLESAERALARLVDARVYVTSDANATFVQRELCRRLAGADRLDIVQAQICRPELLVEIEGIAEI